MTEDDDDDDDDDASMYVSKEFTGYGRQVSLIRSS